MSYEPMKRHVENLNAYYEVEKKANLIRLYAVLFQLYDIL